MTLVENLGSVSTRHCACHHREDQVCRVLICPLGFVFSLLTFNAAGIWIKAGVKVLTVSLRSEKTCFSWIVFSEHYVLSGRKKVL